MVFNSFLVVNVVSLSMKIMNSVIVVGLYYGFLSSFCISLSHLLLFRAPAREEGPEKEIAATTGFIVGQLIMFISIYYAPFYLALCRPHTITALVVPYLFFYYMNHTEHYNPRRVPEYLPGVLVIRVATKTLPLKKTSTSKFNIRCALLHNIIFQFFNHYLLPSPTLARLVTIYMFRCNNKVLFLTGSCVGWLMGQILFIKGIHSLLVWLRETAYCTNFNMDLMDRLMKMNWYPLNRYKFLVVRCMRFLLDLQLALPKIFNVLFFIAFLTYAGRMPVPVFTRKMDKQLTEAELLEVDKKWREEDEEWAKMCDEREEKWIREEEMHGVWENEEGGFQGKNGKELEERWTKELDQIDKEKAKKNEEVEKPWREPVVEKRLFEEDKELYLYKEKEEDKEGENNVKVKTISQRKMKGAKEDEKSSSSYEDSYLDIYQDPWEFEIESELENQNQKKREPALRFEKPLVTFLFDYQRWNRPLRYIRRESESEKREKRGEGELEKREKRGESELEKREKRGKAELEKTVRNEVSQYFFSACPSDGKYKISFTYPPILYSFFKMIEQKMSLYTTEKPFDENNDLYNSWVYTNEQAKHNLNNELINRIKAIEKQRECGCLVPDVLEKRIRLYIDENEDENEGGYLPEKDDPFLSGPYRGELKELDSSSTRKDSITSTNRKNSPDSIKNRNRKNSPDSIKNRNRIHSILTNDYREFEDQGVVDNASLSTVNNAPLSTYIDNDRVASIPPADELSFEYPKASPLKEVPRRSRELLEDDLFELKKEEEEEEKEAEGARGKRPKTHMDCDIRPKKYKRVVIIKAQKKKDEDPNNPNNNEDPNNPNNKKKKKKDEETEKSQITTTEKSQITTTEKSQITTTEKSQITTTEKSQITTTKSSSKSSRPSDGDESSRPSDGDESSRPSDGDEGEEDEDEDVSFLRFPFLSNFTRDLIRGSMRAQRRKTVIWNMLQPHVHSPLFLVSGQIRNPYLDLDYAKGRFFSALQYLGFYRSWMGTESELSKFDSGSKYVVQRMKQTEQDDRIAVSLYWDLHPWVQGTRGLLLLTQSFLRKYIKLPFLIITKNIGRMLLLQFPEFYEDFLDWNREMHVKCTYEGIPFSENEFPENWLTFGIQIKIMHPFSVKPWQGAEGFWDQQSDRGHSGFLTVFGKIADKPFGSPRKEPSFFEPVLNDLQKKYRKGKKKWVRVQNILKRKVNPFLIILKEKTKGVLKLVKRNKGEERYEILNKELNEKNAISNQNTEELIIQSTKNFLIEKEIQNLIDRRITTSNQIEQIKKDKKELIFTQDLNSISPNNTNWNDKKQKLWKKILPILKKRSIRFIRKLQYFIKYFIEKMYMDLFLYIINILRINIELLVESRIISSREKRNQEEIDSGETNKIPFILTIKNLFSNPFSNSNTNRSDNLNIYRDLPYLSQAYVFYKLSQTQFSNKSCLRPVLQYDGTRLFLKDKIKKFCERQGIFDPKTKHNQMDKSISNQWKNWLKGHYQYNLSHTKWSRLKSKKWKKKANKKKEKRCTIPNKDSIKLGSYKKEKNETKNLLRNRFFGWRSPKAKFQKTCRYDLLLHKYLSHTYRNYENGGDSHIYGSALKGNRNQEFPYNLNVEKPQSLYGLVDISDYLSHYLEFRPRLCRKRFERKYFHCEILDIATPLMEGWARKGFVANMNQDGKNQINIYDDNKKSFFFDWMGMNERGFPYQHILNRKTLFLPEFRTLADTYYRYKRNPWVIPIKLLLNLDEINLDENGKISENPNLKRNKQKDIHISKIKDSENPNLKRNKQKDIHISKIKDLEIPVQANSKKANGTESEKSKESGKGKKKKKSRVEKAVEESTIDFLLYQMQAAPDVQLRENLKTCCFLLRLPEHRIKKPEWVISFIRRNELDLDLLGHRHPTEWIDNEDFIIEPLRFLAKWNPESIIYQMISIDLVNKSKYQTNNESRKQKDVDKNDFKKSMEQGYNSLLGNENPNSYDFLIPEHILSTRHRRKLRILNCLNSRNRNGLNEVLGFGNENNVKGCGQFRNEDSDPHLNTNKLLKLRLFLWPNFRLEDLACMNRYWFNTNNGSRFPMLRIRMYPRFPMN